MCLSYFLSADTATLHTQILTILHNILHTKEGEELIKMAETD